MKRSAVSENGECEKRPRFLSKEWREDFREFLHYARGMWRQLVWEVKREKVLKEAVRQVNERLAAGAYEDPEPYERLLSEYKDEYFDIRTGNRLRRMFKLDEEPEAKQGGQTDQALIEPTG